MKILLALPAWSLSSANLATAATAAFALCALAAGYDMLRRALDRSRG